MSTITTRSGKGSPLTNNEVDSNFTNLNTDKAELSGATFTGEIVANAGIALGDNDKATFGASDDLQIYHDGSNSYIEDSGTGRLNVKANVFRVYNAAGNEISANFVQNGAVELYYDSAGKLATTSTGIDVTGTATMDGLVVDGSTTLSSLDVDSTTPQIKLNETDVTDENTQIIQASGSVRFRTVTDAGALVAERLRIDHGTGDISFYEDTGTTAKLFWDASAEQLTSNKTILTNSNSNNSAVITSTTGNLELRGSGDDYYQFFLKDGGNVGIGTSSPQALTHLYTESDINTADTLLKLTNVANTARYVGFQAQRDNASGQGLNILITKTDASVVNALTIDTAANVGIGTSSPATGLHLEHSNAGATSGTIRIQDRDSQQATNQQTGGIEFYTQDATNPTEGVSTAIKSFSASSSGGAYLTLSTTDVNTSTLDERMRITSDGEIRTSNAVIVGRLADRQTQAAGVTDATLVLAGNSNISGAGEEIGKVAFYNQDASGYGHNLAATIKALTTTSTGANADLVFSTKQGAGEGAEALESMRIDSSGRVGIGTSSPANKFHVYGGNSGSGVDVATFRSASGAFNIKCSDLSAANPTWTLRTFSGEPLAFGQGTDERMRIDSSGNLLVGKTGVATSTAGIELRASNLLNVTRAGGQVLQLNRLSSDGEIAKFLKDGTPVGSIGTFASDITIGKTGAGLRFEDSTQTIRPHNISTNTGNDANVTLGNSDTRFKDLYLSGGVTVSTSVENGTAQFKTLNANLATPSEQFYVGNNLGDVDLGNKRGALKFFTGTTEKMRIDSSGNLLVGKTATAYGTAGVVAYANGGFTATKSADAPVGLNRLSSDGSILNFAKDGTTVGSIGAGAGDLIVGNGSVGIRFNDAISTLVPRTTGDVASNGVIDIGAATAKFKNLYLSGGVYLGGTGAANKLDDYEEGTWTPTVYAADGTTVLTLGTDYALRTAAYTKIGQLVRLSIRIEDLRATKENLWFTVPFASIDNDAVVGSILPSAQLTPSSYGTASIYATYTKFRLTKGNYRYPYGSCSYRTNS
ncbi:hypothetical protein N9163_00780 [bacterium]|nr:hypothetical protein [bacterium]